MGIKIFGSSSSTVERPKANREIKGSNPRAKTFWFKEVEHQVSLRSSVAYLTVNTGNAREYHH